MQTSKQPGVTGWFYIAVFFLALNGFTIANGDHSFWTLFFTGIWIWILYREFQRSMVNLAKKEKS